MPPEVRPIYKTFINLRSTHADVMNDFETKNLSFTANMYFLN